MAVVQDDQAAAAAAGGAVDNDFAKLAAPLLRTPLAGRWKLGRKLGSGAFGIVYLATYVDDRQSTTGSCVAKKICPKLLPAADKPLLESEMKIWSQVDHPSCVKFVGACLSANEYLLLSEYMPGGSLLQRHQRLLKEKTDDDTLLEGLTPMGDEQGGDAATEGTKAEDVTLLA